MCDSAGRGVACQGGKHLKGGVNLGWAPACRTHPALWATFSSKSGSPNRKGISVSGKHARNSVAGEHGHQRHSRDELSQVLTSEASHVETFAHVFLDG